jgi:hypothetical protein
MDVDHQAWIPAIVIVTKMEEDVIRPLGRVYHP